MKTILFASSIFFLLGLKLSSFIDIKGKTVAIEHIITNKILQKKPSEALPLFKNSEQEEDKKTDDKKPVETPEKENTNQEQPAK
jgi:hypothetical protein